MSKILSCEINVKKQICRKKKNELPDMEIDMGQGHRESDAPAAGESDM